MSPDHWLEEEADGFGTASIYTIILEHFVPNIAEDISFLIRYNTEYYYPEWFEFRVIFSPDRPIDGGGFGFTVTDFEVRRDGRTLPDIKIPICIRMRKIEMADIRKDRQTPRNGNDQPIIRTGCLDTACVVTMYTQ